MTLLPTRIKADTDKNTIAWTSHLAEFVIRFQKSLLLGMGLLIIGLLSFIPQNQLNDVFVQYFDERIQFRTDTDFIVENLTGVYFIDFSLDSKESNGHC